MSKRLLTIATFVAFILAFAVGCATNDANITPKNEAVVPLLSDAQKAYITMPREKRIAYFADKEKRKEMQSAGYYPLTVTLSWEKKGDDPVCVVVSEKPSLADPCFTVITKKNSVEIENLKIATDYYWTVRAEILNFKTPVYTFTTEDMAPRLVKVDGVPNVRDLGGRIGLDGRRVKQGLIYRSAGLNNNASQSFMTKEEALARPEVKAEVDTRKKTVAALEADLKEKKNVQYVPCTLGKTWTVFRPAKEDVPQKSYAEFGELTAIPVEFKKAKAEAVIANKDNTIVFPGTTPFRPAFFIQEFESPADGVMQIGIGSDWAFSVYINGKLIFDAMRAGDMSYPPRVDNNILEIPVKKGKNILAVPQLSGAASWTFCCGKPTTNVPHNEVVKKLIDKENKMIASATRISKGMIPGKNRMDAKTQTYVIEKLGWKSDIDLRSDGECYGMTGSPAGEKVQWFHISSSAYGGMKSESGKVAFAKVFKVFLDEKNYPIDFHCIAGQDRTGAVAFILNGLLGVSENELYLDWEVTGFWNVKTSFNHKDRFNKLVAVFMEYPGKDLNEKIENYVLSVGFTREQINWFREFMLEKKK